MRLPSWYRILENSREASLELAAAAVESYAALYPSEGCKSEEQAPCAGEQAVHGSQERGRIAGSPGAAHCRDRGDFLFDWMRLNVDYLNQVALLGSNYASVAARGLNALYERGKDGGASARRELELQGYPGEHAIGSIVVRNDRSCDAQLTFEGLHAGRLNLPFRAIGARDEVVDALVTLQNQEERRRFEPVELAPGESFKLAIIVPLDAFESGRRYHARLLARLADCVKPISLIVRAVPR